MTDHWARALMNDWRRLLQRTDLQPVAAQNHRVAQAALLIAAVDGHGGNFGHMFLVMRAAMCPAAANAAPPLLVLQHVGDALKLEAMREEALQHLLHRVELAGDKEAAVTRVRDELAGLVCTRETMATEAGRFLAEPLQAALQAAHAQVDAKLARLHKKRVQPCVQFAYGSSYFSKEDEAIYMLKADVDPDQFLRAVGEAFDANPIQDKQAYEAHCARATAMLDEDGHEDSAGKLNEFAHVFYATACHSNGMTAFPMNPFLDDSHHGRAVCIHPHEARHATVLCRVVPKKE